MRIPKKGPSAYGLKSKWIIFFVVSLALNLALITSVRLSVSNAAIPPVSELRISLNALSAPSGAMPVMDSAKPVEAKKQLIRAEKNSEKADVLTADKKPVEKKKVQKKAKKKLVQKKVKAAKLTTSNKGKAKSTVVHKARSVRQVPPIYPRSAVAKKQQGLVILMAHIGSNGLPGKIRISRSSGHGALDKAALSAVRKWRFSPQKINGRSTASWVRVPVRFALKN